MTVSGYRITYVCTNGHKQTEFSDDEPDGTMVRSDLCVRRCRTCGAHITANVSELSDDEESDLIDR